MSQREDDYGYLWGVASFLDRDGKRIMAEEVRKIAARLKTADQPIMEGVRE